MKSKQNNEFLTGCLTFIVVMLISFLIVPISALGGFLTGWILSWTVGNLVCSGMNTLFGTTFRPENLPIIFAALGAIGAMFKTVNTTKSNK